jgi:VWFA-related protein
LGNSQGTLPAIETLGAALKPLPGRKNIIWITYGGIAPLSPGNADPGFKDRLATTLDKEGVTMSSVNQATGVDSGDPRTLDRFAQLTGGKVYFHNIEQAVKEVIAGSRSNYVIEYEGPRPDGKYHKIRVACSRKGVRLQVKQGYYAN